MEQFIPDVVCPSVTMQAGVPETRDLITALWERMAENCPKILVGGPAFIVSPRLAKVAGADGTAVDAEQSVMLANRLVA